MKLDDPKPESLKPTQSDQPAEPSIYEQLNDYLYDYHFGRITFLGLLDKWKEVLGLLCDAQQENS